jgi:hypothetical protein
MSDPFLDAHRQAPLRYTISGPQPISIRDQITRGATVVDRLIEIGDISASRPLAVVGAGAGGASAAIQAAKHGITTYLIERAMATFPAQSLASTRVLDPTQYDWPLDHCHHGILPWGGHPPLPLSFSVRPADQLSLIWQRQLIRAARRLVSPVGAPFLRVLLGSTMVSVVRAHLSGTSAMPGSQWVVIGLTGGRSLNVGCVIDAKGFGRENCRVEQPKGNLVYEGQPFWGPDAFSTLTSSDSVLVSGSGDGAMQDYLRVVTKLNRAIEIEKQISLPVEISHAIQSAEDRACRGWSWASSDVGVRFGHENPYWVELDAAHNRLVTRALGIAAVHSALDALIPDDPVPATVVHREAYLTCYYGLNRFLAKLVARFIENERGGWRTFFPQWEVANIASFAPTHRCVMAIGSQMHASGIYNGHTSSNTTASAETTRWPSHRRPRRMVRQQVLRQARRISTSSSCATGSKTLRDHRSKGCGTCCRITDRNRVAEAVEEAGIVQPVRLRPAQTGAARPPPAVAHRSLAQPLADGPLRQVVLPSQPQKLA